MEKAKTFLWLILLLCSFTVEAVSVINKIKYQGNEVTQASLLNREIYISAGDEANEAIIEKSRQAIMDLGLFRSVHYCIEKANANELEDNEDYFGSSNESQVNVVFIVKEKYYLLVLPKFKVEDDVFYYGMQLKWDNIFGLNHESRLLAEDRGSTRGVDENRFLFRYFYPNFNGTTYNIEIKLQVNNDVDETDGVIDRQDDSFQLKVSKWLNKRGRNRGWFAGGGVLLKKRFNEDLVDSSNSEKTDAIILGVDAGYRDIQNFEFNRGGKAYGYKLDWSYADLGSDAEFTRHLFYYKSYYRFDSYPLSNLNVQMQLGHSNDDVLGDDAFSLGSSRDLRGYNNDRFNGNTMFLTNFEFMFPEAEHPVIRYVAFIDIGNTYDELGDIIHDELNVGAGFGLRWKIRALVNIDLRADIGYGFTDEDYRVSFGTRHAF